VVKPISGLRTQNRNGAGRWGRSLRAIFGSPDDLKFGSCMTLFALASGSGESVFRHALERFCQGRMDERTVALCKTEAG